MEPMCRQAVILAAGRGSRLAPLTDERPKCLVEVAGRPLIDALMVSLAAADIREVLVVVGYRADAIRRHFASAPSAIPAVLIENPGYLAANNAVSLWTARELLRPPFLLVEGDVWLDPRVVARLVEPDRMAVAASRWSATGTYATVAGTRVTGLDLAPAGRAAGSFKTVNAASFSARWWSEWFRPALERLVATGTGEEFYEVAIAAALAGGAPPLECVPVGDDEWFEIDTPDDLVRAHDRLAASSR
jgi:choline kinase